MERDKRRSKEEEEELDKKIALIREKNLKIEQRSKEVEADRVNNTDVTLKKPATPAKSQPVNTNSKNKTWDREWDQGKTPADQWRENVPSIEHTSKLASASMQNRRRQTNNGSNTQSNPSEKFNKGSLAGRVTVQQDQQNNKAQGNKGRGRRDGQQNNSNKQNEQNGAKTRKENGAPRQEQRNRRRGNSEKKSLESNDSQNKITPKEQQQGQRKPRQQKENDSFAIKSVLKNLLDNVVKMERRQKKDEKQQKENLASIQPDIEQEQPAPVVQTETNEEIVETPKEHSPGKENCGDKSDANQNVIQLTRERVLTVQST